MSFSRRHSKNGRPIRKQRGKAGPVLSAHGGLKSTKKKISAKRKSGKVYEDENFFEHPLYYDDNLAFVAGYTSNGIPYGLTHQGHDNYIERRIT